MEEAEHSKTEEATSYKLEQARNKGVVARGLDFGVLLAVAAVVGYFSAFGDTLAKNIARACQRSFIQAPQLAIAPHELGLWISGLVYEIAVALEPLLGAIFLAGLIAAVAQVGFSFAPAALKPDYSRLNPANGLKRVFSITTVLETLKAVLKLSTYVAIAALVIAATTQQVLGLSADPGGLFAYLGHRALKLLTWFALAAAVFAAIDQMIVRRQFGLKMRMSRRELRDEVRHREGDPRIKQRRKQLNMELLKRARSMRNLRGADLLVTNPTHFAVGLKYDARLMSSPTVVARGSGEFAERLKRIAFIYGVPIIESQDLARGLFFKAQVDEEIPPNFVRQAAAVYLRMRELNPARMRR